MHTGIVSMKLATSFTPKRPRRWTIAMPTTKAGNAEKTRALSIALEVTQMDSDPNQSNRLGCGRRIAPSLCSMGACSLGLSRDEQPPTRNSGLGDLSAFRDSLGAHGRSMPQTV
jgi:hypothetical protein